MIVNARFNGPPNSGNGGYVAGLMAKEIGGVVQVLALRGMHSLIALYVDLSAVKMTDFAFSLEYLVVGTMWRRLSEHLMISIMRLDR
jgi:hypothetical protein